MSFIDYINFQSDLVFLRIPNFNLEWNSPAKMEDKYGNMFFLRFFNFVLVDRYIIIDNYFLFKIKKNKKNSINIKCFIQYLMEFFLCLDKYLFQKRKQNTLAT